MPAAGEEASAGAEGPCPPLPSASLAAGLAAIGVLHLALPLVRWVPSRWRWLGAPLILAGLGLNLRADRLFKFRGPEVKPFREPTALVLEGPFWISRNPMYLGGMSILAGAAVLLGSLAPFFLLPIMFWAATALFIRAEEQELERRFGERYRAYRRRVRRWL